MVDGEQEARFRLGEWRCVLLNDRIHCVPAG